MSIIRKQPTRLVLLGWVVLTILVALTRTAFPYQDQAKQSSETLKDNKPTQTAFTYQGQLKEGSMPPNGTYNFRFALYTGQSGGLKLGVVIKDDVVVTDGSFTVQLDFGSDGFSRNESWLEIGARPAKRADPYTALSPRQRLTPPDYAILTQAKPWNLIGVPVGFLRAVDTGPVPVNRIAVQSVTSERIADGQVVKSMNFIKDPIGPAGGNNTTVKPSGSTLPLAPQDTSTWTKVGTTVRLSTSMDNVGIGITRPIAKLDVEGIIHASEAVRVGNSVGLLSSGSLNLMEVDSNPLAIGFSNPWLLTGNALTTGSELLGTTNNFPLRIFTNNTEKMRILTNGNVGIGTTTPTQRLTLGGGNVLLPNASSNTDGNLYFGGLTDSGQVGMRLFGGLVSSAFQGGFIDVRVNPTNLSDGLIFRVDSNMGGSERMRITASGNVGIGTTAPAARLSVGNNNFRVDSSGNLVRINNVLYSWPAAQGAPSTVLTNNGSGVLTWAPAVGGGVMGNCSSGPNFVTKWSSTSAVTCSQIFDNGTNVGIGTTTPNEQLEITGNFRLPSSTASVGVIKSGANRFIHNFGVFNFFAGVNAGNFTMSACCNTAVGQDAFQSNSTGAQNSALGNGALKSNATGSTNTAIGLMTLQANTGGHNNVAVGAAALSNNLTGRDNIAVGTNAGLNVTGGDFNIYIGNTSVGVNESNTTRIGNTGASNRTFIAGIRNVTTGVANAIPVVIDSNGQLGTISSSHRFKEHIQDMGAASEVLYRLRPVSFLYKPEYGGRPELPQFGLIAEEVAKVAPELVAYDGQGRPYTVYYQFLAPMLLNELQKKDTEIEKLRARLDALEKLVEGLTKK